MNIGLKNELIIINDYNNLIGISSIKFNCYMNNVLQTIFHLDKFRINLMNIENMDTITLQQSINIYIIIFLIFKIPPNI